jgi:hypothetical protein
VAATSTSVGTASIAIRAPTTSAASRTPSGYRERSNHCDYFTPGDRGGGEAAKAAAAAKSRLDALFKK